MLFHIKDTGIGIEKDKIHKIFERFSQAEDKISHVYGGLGLGLSIAYENAELLGSKIFVESTIGFGSLFYFSIPYIPVSKQGQLNSGTFKPLPFTSKHTILIAEDNESNYRYLEILLTAINPSFILLHAPDGKQAIDKCSLHPEIELVLMDLKLPVVDGFEATSQIREFRHDLPIIAQSAYSTNADINKAKAAGCDDYITKPINKDDLVKIINNYCLKIQN